MLAGCIPGPALCFWARPSAGPLPEDLVAPSAGDGWAQRAAGSPEHTSRQSCLPGCSISLCTTPGPATWAWASRQPGPCIKAARPVLHQGAGLCSKSFVSRFNPSQASAPVQSPPPTPALGLAVLQPSLWAVTPITLPDPVTCSASPPFPAAPQENLLAAVTRLLSFPACPTGIRFYPPVHWVGPTLSTF